MILELEERDSIVLFLRSIVSDLIIGIILVNRMADTAAAIPQSLEAALAVIMAMKEEKIVEQDRRIAEKLASYK